MPFYKKSNQYLTLQTIKMVSIAIEAGPIEFQEKASCDKVTLCLMSDHTVSERRYRKNGGLYHQAAYPPKQDLDQGLQALMARCQELIASGCEEVSAVGAKPAADVKVMKAAPPATVAEKRTHKQTV